MNAQISTMKKLLAILVLVVVVSVLSGCSGDQPNPVAPQSSNHNRNQGNGD